MVSANEAEQSSSIATTNLLDIGRIIAPEMVGNQLLQSGRPGSRRAWAAACPPESLHAKNEQKQSGHTEGVKRPDEDEVTVPSSHLAGEKTVRSPRVVYRHEHGTKRAEQHDDVSRPSACEEDGAVEQQHEDRSRDQCQTALLLASGPSAKSVTGEMKRQEHDGK